MTGTYRDDVMCRADRKLTEIRHTTADRKLTEIDTRRGMIPLNLMMSSNLNGEQRGLTSLF